MVTCCFLCLAIFLFFLFFIFLIFSGGVCEISNISNIPETLHQTGWNFPRPCFGRILKKKKKENDHGGSIAEQAPFLFYFTLSNPVASSVGVSRCLGASAISATAAVAVSPRSHLGSLSVGLLPPTPA